MDCGTKNLSTLDYILILTLYLMFEIEIIGCIEQDIQNWYDIETLPHKYKIYHIQGDQ